MRKGLRVISYEKLRHSGSMLSAKEQASEERGHQGRIRISELNKLRTMHILYVCGSLLFILKLEWRNEDSQKMKCFKF